MISPVRDVTSEFETTMHIVRVNGKREEVGGAYHFTTFSNGAFAKDDPVWCSGEPNAEHHKNMGNSSTKRRSHGQNTNFTSVISGMLLKV